MGRALHAPTKRVGSSCPQVHLDHRPTLVLSSAQPGAHRVYPGPPAVTDQAGVVSSLREGKKDRLWAFCPVARAGLFP